MTEELNITKTSARAGRSSSRNSSVRELTREPVRSGTVVEGRNGEILSRKRKVGVDPFDVPEGLVPKGWTYQWNVVSVVGNADVVMDQGMAMYENGWRPVPADRHPGTFVPQGARGEILRGGLRLEERPKSLTDEARADEISTAKQLIADRNDSLKLSQVRNGLPSGFEMSGRHRGTGGRVQMSIDPALDIPSPQYELADDGEP